MKKFYKKFTSKVEMVEQLSSLTNVFDTRAMLLALKKAGPRRLYLVTDEGEHIACDNFKKFISILSTKGGLEFLYPICFGRGETYHVYSKVDYFDSEYEEPVPKVESVVVEEELIEVVTEPEQPVSLISLDTEEVEGEKEEETELEINWEWVESLKNTKDDKMELDIYAETFDIKLNRKNTIDNMRKAFKEQLSQK